MEEEVNVSGHIFTVKAKRLCIKNNNKEIFNKVQGFEMLQGTRKIVK